MSEEETPEQKMKRLEKEGYACLREAHDIWMKLHFERNPPKKKGNK